MTDFSGPLPDGIYIGLSEDTYHGDDALGSGSVRDLYEEPMIYWRDSAMNPHRVPTNDAPALLFGRALHKLVLEGIEAFDVQFGVEPNRLEYPGSLESLDDLKSACKAAKLPVSGSKAELVERLRGAGVQFEYWPEILANARIEAQLAGRSLFDVATHEKLMQLASYVKSTPEAIGALTSGLSEVSVFWTRNGVRCKARFDYLRLAREGDKLRIAIIDLKSFAARNDDAPHVAVVKAICNTRLDIQAAHYLDGAAQMARFIADGAVYGAKGVAKEWFDAISMAAGDAAFFWLFASKDAPISLVREAKPGLVAFGRSAADRALANYSEYLAQFGSSWRYVDPMPDKGLDVQDMPPWFGRGVA